MNIKETFNILKEEGITTHEESVRRWIREGKIKATLPSKKEGYRIEILDLLFFMQTKLSEEQFKEVTKKYIDNEINKLEIDFFDKELEYESQLDFSDNPVFKITDKHPEGTYFNMFRPEDAEILKKMEALKQEYITLKSKYLDLKEQLNAE